MHVSGTMSSANVFKFKTKQARSDGCWPLVSLYGIFSPFYLLLLWGSGEL